MKSVIGWSWFVVVQLIMLFFTVLGWVLLIWPCLWHAWSPIGRSIKDKRVIDQWNSALLGFVYDNPEDGVGRQASIWVPDTPTSYVQQPYIPPAGGYLLLWLPYPISNWAFYAWRAYCWSAWRNSCDNLKYFFDWPNGPQALILGRKVGWWPYNGYNLPVL